MADRSIVVRLRAQVNDYVRSMNEARQVTEGLGKSGTATQGSLDRMVQSARKNSAEWTTAGQTFLAVGGAIAAIGAAALKTGIEYNTLQQTSRAALTTLLGNAKAANEQMDKLDEFARSSPFSKQVFINAQRQMLGFGIASERVIPYLDAIQNAVAAMGGSNQDISELSRIISQISASAKITATDLREFGNRGVDAATIIGSQMGKTGAQIRQDITAGTLDAQAALDALAAGMQARFGGAADNVKDTFAGALDRVKAAWRDLSSSLAEPLVGKEGGGFLVDLLNDAADMARVFEGMPAPVKTAAAALVGLTGAVTLLGGAFLTAMPRIVATRAAFATLSKDAPRAAAAVSTLGRAAGVAAGALTVIIGAVGMYSQVQANARQMTESLSDTLDAQTGALTANSRAWIANELTKDQSFGVRNSKSMVEAAEEIGVSVETLTAAYEGNTDAVREAKAAADAYAAESNIFNDAALSRASLVDRFNRNLDDQVVRLEEARKVTGDKAKVDADGAAAQDDLAGAYRETKDEIEEQTSALSVLIDKQREAAGIVLSQRDAEIKFQQAVDGAKESVQQQVDELKKQYIEQGMGERQARLRAEAEVAMADKLDITTEAGQRNRAALDDIAESGYDLLASMEANGATQEELQSTMATTRQKFIEAATAMGMAEDDARALANQLGLIPQQITTTYNVVDNATPVLDSLYTKIWRLPAQRTLTINTVTNENVVTSGRGNMIARARGGVLPGAPSAVDNMVIRAASGEFVVNARATQQHRALLEAINSSTLPGYANGGQVGRPQPAAPTGFGGFSPTLSLPADGWSISGSLNIGGALVPLVDARISAAQQSRTSMTRQGVRR